MGFKADRLGSIMARFCQSSPMCVLTGKRTAASKGSERKKLELNCVGRVKDGIATVNWQPKCPPYGTLAISRQIKIIY